MAFKTSHYDTLLQIATDLDANSDPALIKKCSDYFMANEQFDKAVNLLAVGRKVGISDYSRFCVYSAKNKKFLRVAKEVFYFNCPLCFQEKSL